VEIETDLAWNFILCFVLLLRCTALTTLHICLCISVFSFCTVHNNPSTCSDIPNKIKMFVKYKYKNACMPNPLIKVRKCKNKLKEPG
jgi:hypothetical protein